MTNKNETMLLTSSNEEPVLKWTAPRAPQIPRNISPSERYEYIRAGVAAQRAQREFDEMTRRFEKIGGGSSRREYSPKSGCTREELLTLFPEIFDEPAPEPQPEAVRGVISHPKGECKDRVTICSECVTLKRAIRTMRYFKDQIEEIIEFYYVCLGKMPTHMCCIRAEQDQLTFAKQNEFMRAQLARGLIRYSKHLGTKYRSKMFRDFMIDERDHKDIKIERGRSRDLKYESKFLAQGLGPIEHARGDCSDYWSMCEDCCSIRKCYTMGKQVPARLTSGYGLFWRLIAIMRPQQAEALCIDTIAWIQVSTLNCVNDALRTYFMYSNDLGANYWIEHRIYEALKKRQIELSPHKNETKFVAQAFTLAQIDFSCPSLDRLTDMMNRLIVNNNIGVDAGAWARRMTSFVLMLMQLCAESSLFIKITAVAQFLTHFDLPGLASFRGYAQQLAQVFQAAVEKVKRSMVPTTYDLHEGLTRDDDDDDVIYDADTEGPFRAQGDDKSPEGVLIGTAKLFCAMAGITDYDIKTNGVRIARIDQLSRTIVSTERLTQFIGKLFKYGYEIAMVHVFNVHPDMRELRLVSEKIPAWMDRITDYYNSDGLNRVTKNIDEARRVLRWHREGDEYNALLWKFKVMPKAYAIFKNVYNMCDRLAQASSPYLAESAMRVSPFTILITGGAGLGKSVMQYSLITDIMRDAFAERGLVYKPGEQIHVHTSGGKHWDGYHEQAVVVVDDVFQSKDPAETVEQCMDICRMKNMVTWPVAKADLASKGTTFMVSELLVMTGNVAVPHDITSVVRSFDAIRRRIDMLIVHSVVPEYLDKSGRLDKQKVAEAFPITYVDGLPVSGDITPIFRFDVFDNQNRLILKNGRYDQLVSLAQGMKRWEKDHEEGVIRANYLRAGLDVNGLEKTFTAQMWKAATNIVYKRNDDDDDDALLFEEDVAAINAMLRPHANPLHFHREGFLTEEERIEIFAAISQGQPPDDTWSGAMSRTFHHVRDSMNTSARRFFNTVVTFNDAMKERIQSSLMFKVGALVTIAISIISLGMLSYKMFARDKIQDVTVPEEEVQGMFVEVSGDEKTRQTRTRFVNARAQSDNIVKVVHGKRFVAVERDAQKTVWVPEGKTGGRKPIKVSDALWDDDGEELPHDVIGQDSKGQMIAQACPDRNAYNIGINRVTNNAVIVEAHEEGRTISKLRGLFVYGRVLMLPNHFFHGMDMTDQQIDITTSNGVVYKFNINECEIKRPKESMDVIFLRLPRRFQCFADIRSHFHSVDGVNKYQLSEAMLWIIDGENNSKMITLCDNITKDTVLDYSVTPYVAGKDDETIHIIKSYVYRGVTLAGYCGAPLIWINSSVQGGHILGIHVAGSNLRGLTTPITREFLYSFLNDWNDIAIKVPTLDHSDGVMTAQSKRAVSRSLGLAHYGRVAAKNQVRLPCDTNIIPSPLHGVFEPTTGPALLTPTKEHNPLRKGILKQRVPLVVFDDVVVEEAVAHLKNAILSVDSPYKRWTGSKVLTRSEALNGVPGDQWIPPMNLHTSPGYPYTNANTSKNGKFDFVEGEPGERILIAEVDERLEKRIAEAKNGVVSMTLFIDILKDERVKLSKIADGKTRIFNVAPFDLNMAVRMYFQLFAAHVMHNHVYGECAVGLNPHSAEWGMMYHYMQHEDAQWIGGDYSNYDKQLSYQLLKAVLEIIDDFYDDGNERVRECLFETMFSAFHIAERDVYRVPQGNPSGIVMTSLINSLVNSLMMRIIYIELGGSMTTFDDYVRLKTYGDDNIASVMKGADWFNMVSISRQFATHGIVYNQPNKEAMTEDLKFMDIKDLTFLKRGFREESGKVLAPLSMDSIHEMVNWIRSSNDDAEATRANFLAACREMYHHGREAFGRFTSHVYKFAQQHAFHLPYTNYVTSGEYWGGENVGRVNFTGQSTTQLLDDCCDLGNEETLFSVQSSRAPRKTKAVWQSMCDLLFIALIINTTSNTEEPNDTTAQTDTLETNVATRNEITSFTDTSVVSMVTPQYVPPIPPTPVDPYMKQQLTAWLSRTYYQTYDWSSSSAMGELLLQIRFPNFLLSVVPIWDKLKNFTYFRAGVKIGIRLNGSKFHFGQLLVSYSPNFNNTGDLAKASNNIYSASGCPCFTISAAENEVHEFELPYALPYPIIPLYDMGGALLRPQYDIGVVNVYVLNPLANASGPTTISWTIFANFVDVDVAGYQAVAYTIPTRSVLNQASYPAILPPVPAVPPTDPVPDPLPPVDGDEGPFLAQGVSGEQRAKSSQRLISGVLDSISSVAGALSVVPGISTVATGVSAMASGGSKIARYFGYTNPVSLIASNPVIGRYGNMTNTHGLCDAVNLTMHPDATVSASTGLLGGCECEMELSHIVQTPSLLAAGIQWTAAQVPSQTIWMTPVSAAAEMTSPTLVFPNLLSFTTRSCLLWRGSIRYHMQITCSQMHVGRLRISYQPYVLGGDGQLTADQLANLPSLIVDVQQQTSISFTIPYLAFKPWCNVTPNTIGRFTGWIRISVLNVLNHPSTPVPTVNINVWTSAGPDFQLARPELSNTRTGIYTSVLDEEVEETKFVAQGLSRDAIKALPAPPLIPASGSHENNICVPDEVHHLKDMIMRPGRVTWSDTYSGNTTYSSTYLNPWAPIANPLVGGIPCQSFRDYFRMIFRFSRGSVRYGVCRTLVGAQQDASDVLENGYSQMAGVPVAGDWYVATPPVAIATDLFLPSMANGALFTEGYNQPCTAIMPYYSDLYGVPNAVSLANAPPISGNWYVDGILPNMRAGLRFGCWVWNAAGDDHELVYLVGPPAFLR